MAQYSIGDKVKFLNQVGGGVVTKVTPDFVFVQDDTGFEMPMQASELIRMADMKGSGKLFNDKSIEKKPSPTPATPRPAPLTPEEENKQLRSQIANLRDQVAKLQKQLNKVLQQNSRQIAENILLQHETAPGEAEVDLHIEMLHNAPARLAPHEAFEIQMRYFRTCMNHAILNHFNKVTFIHGVGKGVLKDEIYNELGLYSGIHYFDAPMQKYGVGATEVYFGNKVEKNTR